jgi:hypothetical protein
MTQGYERLAPEGDDTVAALTASDLVKGQGNHQSIGSGLLQVYALPQAFTIREDATNNTFHAKPTDVSLCINALQPSPQSHHAQVFIVQADPPCQVDGSPVASTLRGFGHGWQGQHNSTNAVVQEAGEG